MNTQRRDGRKKNSAGGGKTAPSIFYRQIRPQPYQPRKPRTLASPDRAAPSIRMKGDSKSTSIAQPFHKKNKKKTKGQWLQTITAQTKDTCGISRIEI
jgi:hypothetical protein